MRLGPRDACIAQYQISGPKSRSKECVPCRECPAGHAELDSKVGKGQIVALFLLLSAFCYHCSQTPSLPLHDMQFLSSIFFLLTIHDRVLYSNKQLYDKNVSRHCNVRIQAFISLPWVFGSELNRLHVYFTLVELGLALPRFSSVGVHAQQYSGPVLPHASLVKPQPQQHRNQLFFLRRFGAPPCSAAASQCPPGFVFSSSSLYHRARNWLRPSAPGNRTRSVIPKRPSKRCRMRRLAREAMRMRRTN